MLITVHYTTQLKAALNAASEPLELDSPVHLNDVLRALDIRHGATFRDLVYADDGRLLPSILLCLGDNQIDPSYADPLQDGDVITLLSAISGG